MQKKESRLIVILVTSHLPAVTDAGQTRKSTGKLKNWKMNGI
jgi:hypothetical protein